MSSSFRHLGLDIGGTKIALAAVEGPDRIVASAEIPTRAEVPFSNALPRILQATDGLLAKAGWQAGMWNGIGIGCAGPVDPQRGTIHNPYTLPGWPDADIVAPLTARYRVPVQLENDVDAALVGQWHVGAARGASIAVMLTFGTGVGSSVMIGGRIYRGLRGEHPELGHVIAAPRGPECYCGMRGCLEALACGPALARAGQAIDLPDSRAVFQAASEGHVGAGQIVDRALSATTNAVWAILHTFMPDRLVLGGGIMRDQYTRFAQAAQRAIDRAELLPSGGMSVVQAVQENDAGVLGAAYLPLCEGDSG